MTRSAVRRTRRMVVILATATVTALSGAACTAGTGTDGTATAPRATNGVRSIAGAKIKLTRAANVERPTSIATRPGTDDLYVTSQTGRVVELHVDRAGTDSVMPTYRATEAPVLDLTDQIASGGERGLLGLAFSPGSEQSGQTGGERLYVYYTDKDGRVTIDEYTMNGRTADPASRRNLLSLEHRRPNHNGGQLVIGPDHLLYIGTGDGGGGGDPDENGQNPKTLLGKILRIDPSRPAAGKPYGIPEDNPFASGTDGAPEVWIYGARNPWRFSFDKATNDLWIGDVGQDKYEEIDLLPSSPAGAGRGVNLGWNLLEGTHPYADGPAPANAVGPIQELTHDAGNCSVTGGYVWRGPQPELTGIYLYADLCVGDVRGLLASDGKKVDDQSLGASVPTGNLSSFGQDNAGRIYIASLEGQILLVEAG